MDTQKIEKTALHFSAETLTVALCFIFIFIGHHAGAQKIWGERKGCVRSQGNLAPGYLFQQHKVSAYITGEMELFFDDRFAYTGSVWFSFVTTHSGQPGIRVNEALFSGANYHFLKPGRWDPYVGLTPGVGLVRVDYKDGEELKRTPYTAAPLISASIGCNYYVGWLFHFFVKVQGVSGQVFSNMPTPARIDELKITAGLGWNIRLWKPTSHDTWKK